MTTPARRNDENGMAALVLAVSVSTILFATAYIVFQLAISNVTLSATYRVENQAESAAEGGVDRAFAAIQAATAPANLPCTESETLATAPTKSSYSATITYYSTFPVTSGALTCSAVQGGTVPAAAVIDATGTDGTSSTHFEALVKISMSSGPGNVFNYAMFSNASFTSGNITLTDGTGENQANVYTNGSLLCGSNYSVAGNVILGTGTLSGGGTANFSSTSGNCSITGSIESAGTITTGSSNLTVGGNLEAVGKITLAANTSVTGSATSESTVTSPLPTGVTVKKGETSDASTLPTPIVQESLPAVPEPTSGSTAAAAWASAGYTTVITNNTCTTGSGGIYSTISALSSATTPEVIMTTCALTFSSIYTLTLAHNAAIFSTGGFTFASGGIYTLTTSASTGADLYLMVPSSVNGTAVTCSSGSPGITENSGDYSFSSKLDVLMYTPCTISVGASNDTMYGQMYAGTISLGSSNVSVEYEPVPTVPGSSGGGAVAASTTEAVVYERQSQS